jgi:mono/diheme cytochrome c family protein
MKKYMDRRGRLKFYWAVGLFMMLSFGLLAWSSPRPATGGQAVSALQLATPTPRTNPTATPPTQGGRGHDVFYIHCMPCHGDVGQGLTDEFRFREYPPEDTNCWKSGCHGPRPYESGFTLPATVPAIIGSGALRRFPTAQNMYAFMRATMPFNAPGSLSDEQYLELTAFLLEQNQFTAQGSQLNAATLQDIVLQPAPTPTPVAASPAVTASDNSVFLLPGIIVLLSLAVILYLVARSRSGQSRP